MSAASKKRRKREARARRTQQEARPPASLPVLALVTFGGAAALSWETLWQIEASLALGVSAFGAAITLAVTMAGMTAGSLWMGRRVASQPGPPLRLYALLELAIGVSGLLLRPAFAALEGLDTLVYAASPGAAPLLHLAGIAAVLGVPSLAMGATIPVFERIARASGTSVSRLYGMNTAGAAAGTLVVAFVTVPALGLPGAVACSAAINLGVAALAWRLSGSRSTATDEADGVATRPAQLLSPGGVALLVATTGFATFALEVVWFRSLVAAFQSTTESFALMLAAVLVSLALGAQAAPRLRRAGVAPALLVGLAGIAVLLATPIVERVDLFAPRGLYRPDLVYGWLLAQWLGLTLLVVGPAVLLLGTALPICLDAAKDARAAARIYAVNTLGAVVGAIGGVWLLLPTLGAARSAWVVGALLVVVAAALAPMRRRVVLVACGAAALGVAIVGASSLGRERIQTSHALDEYEILAFEEGPDATVSVVETPDGRRRLLIDGFTATSENDGAHTHYMAWMGRLPMLLHPAPQRALVIAFGTGQTAAALLDEAPERLDVVEISDAVLRVSDHFTSNGGVLHAPRVDAHVMDGRAWIRRTDRRYDVVTLEPMPPYFRGVNALYAREFYERVAERLTPDGVVAQWLPFHLVTVDDARAVTRTFIESFPDSVLWIDPAGGTGILLGRRAAVDGRPLGDAWPGLRRAPRERGLTEAKIRRSVVLRGDSLAAYAASGARVTDANQRLAYGLGRGRLRGGSRGSTFEANMREVTRAWERAR